VVLLTPSLFAYARFAPAGVVLLLWHSSGCAPAACQPQCTAIPRCVDFVVLWSVWSVLNVWSAECVECVECEVVECGVCAACQLRCMAIPRCVDFVVFVLCCCFFIFEMHYAELYVRKIFDPKL
jgi:hypothetical protein